MTDSERQLVDLYLDGVLPESEHALLFQRLETDPEALVYLASRTQLNVDLRRSFKRRKLQQTAVACAATSMVRQPRSVWFSWRPLAAAAAGIVFGMFCTSVVFAYVGPSLGKVMTLLQESFESGPAPLVASIPQEVNLWSGDYSEIVGEQQGVKPAQGMKMVRVLRSDFEGRKSSKPSRHGDLMRIVDVRPFLREANGGEVVISVSALFNAAPFAEAERYDGVITLYALGQLGSTEETLYEDALALSFGECRSLDRDPTTWQSASARCLLPPGAKFVMMKVSFRRMPKGSEDQSSLPDPVIFAGHFVDEVRASVSIRKAVPDHSTQALP